MIAWWNGRTARERWMLGALAVLALAVVLWMGVLTPLGRWAGRAAAEHDRALQTKASVDRALADMAALKSRPAPKASQPLETLINETATAAGVTVGRLEPDPAGGMRVAIEGGQANAVFPWIARLQTEHGVAAQSLTVLKEGEGLVVEATFVQAGR